MGSRFLISRLSALGDVVCTLPVASALKKGFPDSEVVWAVDPRFASIVERCSSVDKVFVCKPGLAPNKWPQVEGEFDVALDMQGLLKSALVVGKAKAERKVGYHWQREGAQFFSQKVLPDPTSIHIVDQYVDVARAVGGVAHRAEFALAPNENDLASIQTKLAEKGTREPFIVLNAGAGWVTKRWPVEHCGELARHLHEKGIQTVLIGGRQDEDRLIAESVKVHFPEVIDLVGETSIAELIALISLGAAHVGGDTGSSHLAAAMNRPAIGLYSITRPERSCPYGQMQRCHYNSAGLASIQPSDVYQSVVEAIG